MMEAHKIRILFGAECFNGGVLKHVDYLVRNMDADSFDVFLIVSAFSLDDHSEKVLQELEGKGIRVERWRINHRITPWSDFRVINRLRKFMEKEKIQIVHAHSSKAGFVFRIAAKWSGVPVIYTPHCFYFTAHKGIPAKIYFLAERILSRLSDRMIISSPEKKDTESLLGKNSGLMEMIDNCIDPAGYLLKDRRVFREEWSIPREAPVIGWIGRFCKQKNWKLFLDTAAEIITQHQEIFFVLAGEGPEKEQAEAHISGRNAEANIRMVGFQDPPALFFSSVDIFVSSSRWEGLPYTYLEALHYNLPVIIPRTSGIEQMPDSKNVSYYPIGNKEKLTQIILSVAGQIGKQDIRPYLPQSREQFNRFIDRHQEIYRSLPKAPK